MKLNSILCLSFITGALSHIMQEQSRCYDKCAKDVIGFPSANVVCPNDPICDHRHLCSTFQTQTIEPTTTVTITYITITVPSGTVPAYATNCDGCKAYAKACSCWGITSTVETLSTPTLTVTVNVTEYSPCEATGTPETPFGCDTPGVCGSYDYIQDDRCGDEGQCACTFDPPGDPVCVEDVDCDDADPCGGDDDCDDGEICWRYSCCENNVCAALSDVCANPSPERVGIHTGQKVLLPTGKNRDL